MEALVTHSVQILQAVTDATEPGCTAVVTSSHMVCVHTIGFVHDDEPAAVCLGQRCCQVVYLCLWLMTWLYCL